MPDQEWLSAVITMDAIITGIRRGGPIGEDMITGIISTEGMCSVLTEATRNTGIGTDPMGEGDRRVKSQS